MFNKLSYYKVGARYAVLTGRKDAVESSISRIFSVYAVIFQTSSIWGNLIGSLGTLKLLNRSFNLNN